MIRFIENDPPSDSLPGINALLKQLSPKAPELTEDHLRKVLENSWLFMLYDDEHKKVVGITVLTRVYKPTAFFGTVEEVVVDKEYRGNGCGIALVRAAFLKAQEVGMKYVEWTSGPERIEANALYVRLGAEKRSTNVYRFTP